MRATNKPWSQSGVQELEPRWAPLLDPRPEEALLLHATFCDLRFTYLGILVISALL